MDSQDDAASVVKRITRHRAFLPVVVFLVLVGVLAISATLTYRAPVIQRIDPQVGAPGSILMVSGNNFGSERGTSGVVIAGVRPTSSAYLEWTNTQISFRVPSDVQSGMVYVERSRRRSNGMLFTNRNNIPVIVKTTAAPGQPLIGTIGPASGSVGTKLTITGDNFGATQGSGRVLFTPLSVNDQGVQASDIGATERFSGCACDYPYQSWGDKKIVVYVPDGASSGNVTVVTGRGTSNSQYFEVSNAVGTKTYTDKRGYQIHYGVQLSNVQSDSRGKIDLWIPNISNTLSQRHIERIVEPKPVWGDYRGLMRMSLSGFKPKSNYPVNVTYYFDRYAVKTRIDPTKVSENYDTSRKLYQVYTAANSLVPSDNPTIRAQARQIVGTEHNPYHEARLIYNFVTQKLKYTRSDSSTGPVEALTNGSGDSYSLALIYTALLRAVGIPARPVAGVLVYGNKQTVNHYWAEFYLPDFGWVPVDPGLGAGAKFQGFPSRSDATDYYFGNLDNQHVTFTQGLVSVGELNPKDRTVVRSRAYSLQTIAEEVSTGVTSYTATWDAVRVVDWW